MRKSLFQRLVVALGLLKPVEMGNEGAGRSNDQNGGGEKMAVCGTEGEEEEEKGASGRTTLEGMVLPLVEMLGADLVTRFTHELIKLCGKECIAFIGDPQTRVHCQLYFKAIATLSMSPHFVSLVMKQQMHAKTSSPETLLYVLLRAHGQGGYYKSFCDELIDTLTCLCRCLPDEMMSALAMLSRALERQQGKGSNVHPPRMINDLAELLDRWCKGSCMSSSSSSSSTSTPLRVSQVTAFFHHPTATTTSMEIEASPDSPRVGRDSRSSGGRSCNGGNSSGGVGGGVAARVSGCLSIKLQEKLIALGHSWVLTD